MLSIELRRIDQDDILFADEGGRYLMLEFPDDDVPSYTSNMIYELMQRGIIPVIVHPERNTKIMKQPNILYELLSRGCLSQITAGSYVGVFGHKVQKFSKQLLQTGQVYIFASDAHNLPNRGYEMTNAFAKLDRSERSVQSSGHRDQSRILCNSTWYGRVPLHPLNR